MYKEVLKRSIGRELSYNRGRLFDFIRESLKKEEELPFVLPLLSSLLDRDLSLYFFPEVRASYGLTWEKIEEIKKEALKILKDCFKELYKIAFVYEDESLRKEALYALVKFLPESSCSFKEHLKLAFLLVRNLLIKRDESLSLKGALRHDLKELVEEVYGEVSLEVAPYNSLLEKLKKRLSEYKEDEAEAYLLIATRSFNRLTEQDKFSLLAKRKRLLDLIKGYFKKLEEFTTQEEVDAVYGYFESLVSKRAQILSSLEDSLLSNSSKTSATFFLHNGVKLEPHSSNELFSSDRISLFLGSGRDKSR